MLKMACVEYSFGPCPSLMSGHFVSNPYSPPPPAKFLFNWVIHHHQTCCNNDGNDSCYQQYSTESGKIDRVRRKVAGVTYVGKLWGRARPSDDTTLVTIMVFGVIVDFLGGADERTSPSSPGVGDLMSSNFNNEYSEDAWRSLGVCCNKMGMLRLDKVDVQAQTLWPQNW